MKPIKPIKQEAPPWSGKTCDECCVGEYNAKFDNLSLDGRPTLINCKYQTYRRLLSERACNKFKPKQQ